jgi:predicted ATPase/class 3 adenylate cyclase
MTPGAGGGLPTGTATFLFTDLEGSTRLWDEHPDAMKGALARHDEILKERVEEHGGHVVKTTGDGLHAVFASAYDALSAASDSQRALVTADWDGIEALRVRMGIHTGEAEVRGGDYYGGAVNRAARVSAAAHGGQVLVSNATEELARDALQHGDLSLLDLGDHRLRDLARPERLFQLRGPELPTDFPPVRSVDAFPGNLPSQLTSFVGRETAINALLKALEESHLVTLTGVGGVGKTRLAIQAAAELLPRFTDGAWLCELAAAEDGEALVQVVAATLGVRPRPGLDLLESIVEFLRGKRLLLVLDNCEHLLDAAGRLADVVLRDCAGVRLIATSREGLAVEGEHVMPLRSLALPRDRVTAEITTDAVRLFVDRAVASRGQFTLDESNARAVAEICKRLDGIPLAIELAASRVVAMSPSDIATHLDERFRLLTGGRRTAVERHQTLRATVDWSYSMLEERTRQVFDRLGVFVGGFDASAAEAVIASDAIESWDVLDALVNLVGKSMVIAEQSDDGRTRYQLLETLRHYARERLDEHDDSDAWRRRHAAYFAEFAEQVGPLITGPDELAMHRRIETELDNLRAAVTWGLDMADDEDHVMAVRIVAALALEGANNRSLGIASWARRALPYVDRAAPPQRHAVLGLASMAEFYAGEHAESARLAEQARQSGVPRGSPAPTLPYVTLGNLAAGAQQFAAARRIVAEGLAAIEAVNENPWHLSVLASCEAIWETMGGQFESARSLISPMVTSARGTRNPTALVVTLFAFGWSSVEADPDAALAALEEAAELTRNGATDSCFGPALMEAARILSHRGDLSGAFRRLAEGLHHCNLVADYPELAGVLRTSSSVLVAAGRYEEAAVVNGFAQGVLGQKFDMPAVGPEGDEQERAQLHARQELSDQRYEELLARGGAMTFDEAFEYALDALESGVPVAPLPRS